ncbi:hypothetical protein COCSUDRAFT_45847 [Coccomyxa subellipsoidea C-169]|uniref:Uncharacterized protein n=1 Tax=Coccomyxa subellipsoidea (strain C-169) TaxID=574566 RepID=I0Z295_COCSC|nr:hypothetical protein COCSUDRAFT_49306 [Coccomyxa subellipsoidea C-169]XP_005644759.1 hypothetical protein COCSUDRAFT_48648 [Coccomyxa subellipsoidea C-169]XP_005648669.1 hypothetical protein COCSUDRAFT_47150 [Coccomyxa subellipsoidea C-169]XP_005649308.1 hypothetical protein COCSUDRAFT_46935 [Coccomyxa subellipsoidea C-169]XP_005651677.1 hypothetical protein COCSUDRAFT_45740 [Coccomyxa subellipsoidea C-169]XP_005651941.1 hypothetical protein COCSUDRAFT_45847 [Coccomyxa subellipsoidea C-169]|eukprot:XP_005642914.1 hypothetical protein COCSUDRAFT_49306 [Coccomyxa subellipsoidea C-169]
MAASYLQASGLQAGQTAQGQAQRGATAAAGGMQGPAAPEAEAAGPSQAPQPGISRRQLSAQGAEQDIVQRWLAFSLKASSTVAELKRFLLDRGQRPVIFTRSALLARVEGLLRFEHPEGGLEPSAAAVEEITAAVEAAAQPARQRPARQKAPKKSQLQMEAAKSIVNKGVSSGLPVVKLKQIDELLWTFDKCHYLPQLGESTPSIGVALWAVTSTLHRDGEFPARNLSQLGRAAKAPVGLVRAVQPGSDGNQLHMEIWFLEARVQTDSQGEPEAAVAGEGGGARADVEGRGAGEAATGGGVQEGHGRGRGRKRGRRGTGGARGSNRPRRGSRGRLRRPTARAAEFWGPPTEGDEDEVGNLFSESDADDQPAQQHSDPAEPEGQAEGVLPEASEVPPQPTACASQSPLHGCLLADESPQPVPVPNVRLSMQGHAASPAKMAVLVIDYRHIAAALCHPKRLKVALGGAAGSSPMNVEEAATGVALAMLLAEEQNAARAGEGGSATAAEQSQSALEQSPLSGAMVFFDPALELAADEEPASSYRSADGPAGRPSLEVSSPGINMEAAMGVIAGLACQLNPSPQARGHSSAHSDVQILPDDTVYVLTDDRRIVGTAEVVHIGPGTRFHGAELEGFGVICGLTITDATGAGHQKAWLSDTDEVRAGRTPLEAIGGNQMVAVPERCLRFLRRPPAAGE